MDFGADVEGHPVLRGRGRRRRRLRSWRRRRTCRRGRGRRAGGSGHPCFSALCERGFGDVDLVGFDERLAGGLALGVEEGVGHAAADEDGVGLVEQVVDDFDLVGDLGAADDGDEGLVGVGDGLAEVVEFLLHEQAGGGLL